jgi:type I restriction enzyme S subunit
MFNKTNLIKKKLIDICYSKSSRISKNTLSEKNGKYSIFGADGEIKKIDTYDIETSYIAMIKDGASAGKFFLLPPKSSVIGTLVYIINKENCDLKYLYYLLSNQDLNKYKIGSTIPHIYFNDLINLEFEIVSYKEQQKIGSFLSAIDELIFKQEKSIDINMKLISTFSDKIFSLKSENKFRNKLKFNKEISLSDTGETYSGLSGLSKESFIENSNNSKFITYMDVYSKRIINRPSGKFMLSGKQNVVRKNDLLFTISSETVDEVGIVSVYEGNEPAYLNSFCFGWTSNLQRNNMYIVSLLMSRDIRKKIIKLGQGSTRYNLSKNKLVNLKFPIHSNDDQEKIGRLLFNLHNLVNLEKQKLSLYKAVKINYISNIFKVEE